MTPAARVAAAIEILDDVLEGVAAEKALTSWARHSRFAGSKDRAAIRDLVFDALRHRQSYAWLGGLETGRGLMAGACRANEMDLADVFSGIGHAPLPLTPEEIADFPEVDQIPDEKERDFPEWAFSALTEAHGDKAAPIAEALRHRAPVFVRVNLRKTTVKDAASQLAKETIETEPHPLSDTALRVLTNPRRLHLSDAYKSGLIEIQDAGSQYLADNLPGFDGMRSLDYCAGGGGKSLALAAKFEGTFVASDISERRMTDISERANRAGVTIETRSQEELSEIELFDLVLCDAPCSGSGAWRRSPDAKWRFKDSDLDGIVKVQRDILSSAKMLVVESGVLAYATCSLFDAENVDQTNWFLSENPDWIMIGSQQITPLNGGDGFYLSLLKRR
ncbi:MAG: RsmB/NOP family class I SAM-dependent RNA methyltransferase [Pseudoruegeria sp.]